MCSWTFWQEIFENSKNDEKCKNWQFKQPENWGLIFMFLKEFQKEIEYSESWVNIVRKICLEILYTKSSLRGESPLKLCFSLKMLKKKKQTNKLFETFYKIVISCNSLNRHICNVSHQILTTDKVSWPWVKVFCH